MLDAIWLKHSTRGVSLATAGKERAFIVLLLLPRFTIVFILLEDLHGSGARLLKQCRQPQQLPQDLVAVQEILQLR